MEVCGQGIKVIICRDVREVLPVHFPPMTHAQTLEFIKGGVQRLRERCAQQQAAGPADRGLSGPHAPLLKE
jgi:hypothetical protein